MKMDAIEAMTQAAIGLLVSLALTHYWLGFSPLQSVHITAVYFFASFVRGFIVRAGFRKWG